MNKQVQAPKSTIISLGLLFFVFGTAILSSQVLVYILWAGSSAVSFYRANGSFQTLRSLDPINIAIQKANNVIPKGAQVEMSPKEWVLARCKARYALYPLELITNKDWGYFIDFDQSVTSPDDDWTQLNIFRNVIIYAKPGFEFLTGEPGNYSQHYPEIFIAFTFLWTTLFYILTGLAILSLFNISCEPRQKLWYISTSYLVGFVGLTGVTWIYLLLGSPFEREYVFALWTFTLLCIITCSHREFINNLKALLRFRSKTPQGSMEPIDKCFLVLTVVLVSVIILGTVLTPVWSWDAMSHWVMKAKVIFHHKALIFDYTHHNEYPILWPLSVAIQFLFAGGAYEELAKWASASLFCSFIIQLIGGLRVLQLRNKWVWVLTGAFLTCFLINDMIMAYAENAFSAFCCATLVAIAVYFQQGQDKKYLVLAVVMAIGLSTVKLEGAVASGIIAFAFASLGSPPFSSRTYWLNALSISSTGLITGAWALWQYKLGYFSESIHVQEQITVDKIQDIVMLLPKSLESVFGWQAFGFLGVLAVLVVLRIKDRKTDLEMLLLRTAGLLILFTVVAFTTWNAAEISRQVKTPARIFFHALPAMVLYLGCQIKYFTVDNRLSSLLPRVTSVLSGKFL